MKILNLIRTSVDGNVTRGSLYIDGAKYADTIEPAPHWCKGAIPPGYYRVHVTYSPKFKRLMPILADVPGFSGIRIHTGTKAEHTQGCICINKPSSAPLTEYLKTLIENGEEITIHISARAHDGVQ